MTRVGRSTVGRPTRVGEQHTVAFRTSTWLTGLLVLAACRPAATPAKADEALTPREARLAAFQLDLPRPERLTGGAPSRDSLVTLIVHGIERRDTALLRRLALTKEEFAWLVYPSSAQGRPPYDLEPQAFWEMLFFHSDGGIHKALEVYGGTPLGVTGYRCDTTETHEGENRLVGPCVLERRTAAGLQVQEGLFGQLIERRGEWKVMSYANKLD